MEQYCWLGWWHFHFPCMSGIIRASGFGSGYRTKEIGVRKVLGASVQDIIPLISKEFIKLILIAFFIASPSAWYFMNKWLQDYANRINIKWTVFLFAGLFVFAIALVTIGFQATKAALSNPVKSLRKEG